MLKLSPIVKPLKLRGTDAFGSGAYGASRGTRTHRGLDIACTPGQRVFSPFDAVMRRKGLAYADDSLQLVELRGIGDWNGFMAKLLYCVPWPLLLYKQVLAGQEIAMAQTLQERYPGITDHIHLYLYYMGELIDPTPLVLGQQTIPTSPSVIT